MLENKNNTLDICHSSNLVKDTIDDVENSVKYNLEKFKSDIIDKKDAFKDYLDNKIGFWWWKYYITTAFWLIISTPINLSITLLSAITTGQVTTNTYVSSNLFMFLNITILVLTSINSFFRPLEQYKKSVDFLVDWYKVGNDFEDLLMIQFEDDNEKYYKFMKIKERMNTLIVEQEKHRNFIIDIIHLIFKFSLEKRNKHLNWLDDYRKIIKNKKNKTVVDVIKDIGSLFSSNTNQKEAPSDPC